MDRARSDNDVQGRYVSSDSTSNYPVRFSDFWSRWTDLGVHGDPTSATAEKGRVSFEGAVERLVDLAREWQAWPLEKRRDQHDRKPDPGIRW
jgi:creatinine amidohydrolase/Fe(II)-dependent formamide hydrolase-like protein